MTACTIITNSTSLSLSPASSAAMRLVIRSSAGLLRRSAMRSRVYASNSSWAAKISVSWSELVTLKMFRTCSARRLNNCQSSFGAPNSSQMIGMG